MSYLSVKYATNKQLPQHKDCQQVRLSLLVLKAFTCFINQSISLLSWTQDADERQHIAQNKGNSEAQNKAKFKKKIKQLQKSQANEFVHEISVKLFGKY